MLLLLLFLLASASASTASEVTVVTADAHQQNVTLHCGPAAYVNWISSSDEISANKRLAAKSHVEANGDLVLHEVEPEDAHTYTCQNGVDMRPINSVRLVVRSVPPAVTNLTVITHSVYALVTWTLPGDGGYPVDKLVLAYRTEQIENSSSQSSGEWLFIDDIHANATSLTVYHLVPNTTYYFRMFAVNRLGPGHNVSVQADTKYDRSEIDEAKHLEQDEEDSAMYMKITVITVIVVLVTFAILGLGISLLLLRNCGKCKNGRNDLSCELIQEATEEEVMELVPHITLNPSFNIDMLEYIEVEDSPTDGGDRTSLVQSLSDSVRPNG